MGRPRCAHANDAHAAQIPVRVGGEPQAAGPPLHDMGSHAKKALIAFGIPTDFEEWTALAKNRNEWKHRTRPQENDPHTT